MTIPGNIISAADMQFNKSNIIKKEYCANDFLTLHYSESGARLALALQSREERPHPRVSYIPSLQTTFEERETAPF
jgi:hypothetical protein